MSQSLLGQACDFLRCKSCSHADGPSGEPTRPLSAALSSPAETGRGDARGDARRFFEAWRAKPLQIAALAPSGAALAALMTHEIPPGIGQVLELGPGTGVFTRAILARGVRASALTLVEYEGAFAQLLSDRFPEATVIQMDAAKLIGDVRFGPGNFGAVISGLPLLSMRPRTVLRILAGSFGALGDGGSFYQFTYGPSCPVSRKILDRLGLKATRVGGTFANFPPAWVYRISRRSMPRNRGINSLPGE